MWGLFSINYWKSSGITHIDFGCFAQWMYLVLFFFKAVIGCCDTFEFSCNGTQINCPLHAQVMIAMKQVCHWFDLALNFLDDYVLCCICKANQRKSN